jgi:hypothetical protein
MGEASTIIAPGPSRVIAVLARQRAIAAVKRQIQAQGRKVSQFKHREIDAMAEDYVVAHRQRLIAEAWEIVRSSAELLRFYEKEQRERQRWLERNSQLMSNSQSPGSQALPLNECHAQNGASR